MTRDIESSKELEAKIDVLEHENSMLSERAVETMLLGLVAESISQVDTGPEFLDQVLENISILKQIPFCACIANSRGSARILHSYALFAEESFAGVDLGTPQWTGDLVWNNPDLNVADDLVSAGLDLDGLDPRLTCGTVAVVPVACRQIPNGFFLFATDDIGQTDLADGMPLLQRVVHMCTTKLDNLALLDELRDLNAQLDVRVAERTEELIDALSQLRESEERFRALVENTSDWVWEIDTDACFTYASPKSEDIIGRTPAEIQGLCAFETMVPEDADAMAELFPQLPPHGPSPGLLETEHMRADDGRVNLETAIVPFFSGTGKLLGYRGISRDVTDRKAAAQERTDLQKQLLEAQKMQAVGNLAGGIAHDFNNRLHAILGFTQLLMMEKAEDHPDRETLGEIVRASTRAQELIAQLLTFSRRVQSQLRPVDLNEEIRKAGRMLERTLPRMVDIRLELDPSLPYIDADPAHLEQVFINLGINASHAMPGGGRLTFRTEGPMPPHEHHGPDLAAADREFIQLTVTDTGEGMDAETVNRVFEPFFTTKSQGEGTGLGLSMVYGIVSSHEGHIVCESEPGQGTTFRICLAIAASQEPLGVIHEQRSNAELTGTETILLVDDEDQVRDVGKAMLKRSGYEVVTASSGEEALDIYRESGADIDLVILDLSMPGIGGRVCFESLREMDAAVQVIISSGYALDGQTVPSGLPQDCAFLGKPFQMNEMLLMVRQVLED